MLVNKTPLFGDENFILNKNNNELECIFSRSFNANKTIIVKNDIPEISSIVASANNSLESSLNEDKKLEEKIAKEIVIGVKSGLKYTVKRGDTIDKIAKKFGVAKKDILVLNNITNENKIKEGQILYISGVKNIGMVKKQVAYTPRTEFIKALTNIGGLLAPTGGLNRKMIHGNNGIDIDTDCGSPVYSADAGIVVESYDGWNGGYGNYIKIQHNNYSTLYGHLSIRYVNIGEYVEKGTLIGLVGNSGKVSGPTGCHLHFEVIGRPNPLAK